MSRLKFKKVSRSRKGIIMLSLTFILLGCYFVFIYKPSSPEFLELQKQEKALSLPKPWARNTFDYGCQWDSWEQETQCLRDISLTYKDTNVKPTIEQSLIRQGWAIHEDRTINLNSPQFDKAETIHFDSWDLYIKDSPQGKLCAVVKSEYNANYKKNAPWAISLDLFGKTERCDDHAK